MGGGVTAKFKDFSKDDIWAVVRVERERLAEWRARAVASERRARALEARIEEIELDETAASYG